MLTLLTDIGQTSFTLPRKVNIQFQPFLPYNYFVKLQSKLNSPVQVGQRVDFVFPLSQEQEQEQEQQEPPPKSTRTKCQ